MKHQIRRVHYKLFYKLSDETFVKRQGKVFQKVYSIECILTFFLNEQALKTHAQTAFTSEPGRRLHAELISASQRLFEILNVVGIRIPKTKYQVCASTNFMNFGQI